MSPITFGGPFTSKFKTALNEYMKTHPTADREKVKQAAHNWKHEDHDNAGATPTHRKHDFFKQSDAVKNRFIANA